MRAAAALVVGAAAAAAIVACGSSSSAPHDAAPADGPGGACTRCFLHGQWKLDNLSPCFATDGAGAVTGATSTIVSGGVPQCPLDPTKLPTSPWSTDTLTVDCPGHYHLCVTLKAGDAASPKAGDCVVAQACADGDYATASAAQAWAPVAAWLASGTAAIACAQQFVDGGGYAELSATGDASGCGAVTTVFDRVRYCPQRCNANPSGPGCTDCGAGSSGTF